MTRRADRLSLNRETVRELSSPEMRDAAGAAVVLTGTISDNMNPCTCNTTNTFTTTRVALVCNLSAAIDPCITLGNICA